MITNSKQHENLIFLDFDGVCNSFECGSYLNYKNTKYGYDEKIIKNGISNDYYCQTTFSTQNDIITDYSWSGQGCLIK